jgi:hypothetical protein
MKITIFLNHSFKYQRIKYIISSRKVIQSVVIMSNKIKVIGLNPHFSSRADMSSEFYQESLCHVTDDQI